MISADKPVNENERLDALYRYDILDTDAEEMFDELTQLASEICGTPIALISLIDPNRQWFKSKVGLDAKETSRDIAFCAHAIHQKEIFEVSDTLLDERFKDNPLVTSDPNIRFYAGAPLLTPQGYAIGTLCAISDMPKHLDQHQRNALEILGKQVITQLELRLKIKQVEEANARKTDFLSTISHELRTPLNAIISFSQLMLKDDEHQMSEKHRTFVQRLDFSGKRLLGLVNDVLDLNKIESGKLTLHNQKVPVQSYFDSLEGIIQTLADQQSVALSFVLTNTLHKNITIDDVRLTQVILNLASNAIKFSKPGQTVSINVVFEQSRFTIAVNDNGKGIARDEIPLLFNKFQQVGENQNDGSGLGLMITKSIVELMGGSIKLNSVLGKGTLIKVDIPLVHYPTENSMTAEIHAQPNYQETSRILVVEDNEINQEVASAVFKSLGIDIHIAVSGEAALSAVKENTYDLIFMDIHMPGIDGFETSQRIKRDFPEQNIVALTADIFANQTRQIDSAGMAGYVSKPIEISALIRILNQFCPKPKAR